MSKHTAPPATPTSPIPTGQWWDAASFGTVIDAYGKWMRNAARLQEESMHFARTRMQRNVEAATGFAACKTPSEMMAMQSRYASEMMSDYLGEGHKLVDLLKR